MITLGLIVAAYVAISKGEWGPAGIAFVLLLFIFVLIASAGEDSRAYVNRRHYWAMSPEERERERRRAAARVDREEREARKKAYEKVERKREQAIRQRERDYARVLKQKEAEEKRRLESRNGGAVQFAQKQALKPICERCGHDVREVSRSSYNGNIFILYHCPFCSEKKLKKYDARYSELIPPDERKTDRAVQPAQPAFRSEVLQARHVPVTNLNTYRSAMDDIMGTNNRHRREETIVCLNCRSWIRTDSIEVMDDGKRMREYCCPACGARIHFSVA